MDTFGSFFRPNQDVHQLLWIIVGLCIGTIVVMIAWLVWYFRHQVNERKMAWKRFHILAKRYLLTRQEASFLAMLARVMSISQPNQLLTSPQAFERLVKTKETKGKTYEKRLIHSIREKIFGKSLQPNELIRSTHSLPVGTRLFIKYVDRPDDALWGHLADVDPDGLIVIIPTPHRVRFSLRMNTQLDVVAYVPNRDPIEFSTWVKSVIPGHRKMIMLGHSNFVVDRGKNEWNAKIVGPHVHKDRTLDLEKYPQKGVNTQKNLVKQPMR